MNGLTMPLREACSRDFLNAHSRDIRFPPLSYHSAPTLSDCRDNWSRIFFSESNSAFYCRDTLQIRNVRTCSPLVLAGSSQWKFVVRYAIFNCLIHQPGRGLLTVRSSVDHSSSPSSLDAQKSKIDILSTVLELPGSLWKRILTPLNNFGFGNRSIWEGGVGIFIVSGAVLLSLTVGWIKGYYVRNRTQKYQAVIEFSKACGIRVGTPVRIRGVDIGNVINVKSSLERIDVVIQVFDTKVVIPRGSLIEVNQSGLLMDTLIDITPPKQIPQPTAGPLDPHCSEEAVIVCDRQRLKGEQGVNLDDLVVLCTRLAREVDEIGVNQIYSVADRVSKTVDDVKPLLSKVTMLVGDLEPLLKDVEDGDLLKELKVLIKSLNEAGGDLKELNKYVLTPENQEMLQQSVSTLTQTLKNLESISSDISGISGDPATRNNLKNLVESLSRLLVG
ncbi:hypothetical protein KP509_17G036300 [Ceratopteris richardii]|uniref:Mce/MlaD domain-containing protein n=1 Tax=Ceratopteris richardii TaxID=49495 RepID=A0A8T2SW23_CERRI|nr:hypothetical protein KP509_17G036300 [Ceratopteris richardii]KAH7373084.1 hypothetical protein KP509_17G036300 [Ceratopteris richardii]